MVKKFRIALIVFTLLIGGYGVVASNAHYMSSAALTLGSIAVIELFFKICTVKIPPIIPIWTYIFVFLSMNLGKSLGFYGIPHWDKFLHLISGVLLGLVGMLVLWSLNSRGKELYPSVVIGFVLMFAVASAGAWEIFEFTSDALFGLTAQNGSLNDTMWDIICGSFGGSIVCIILYLYYYRGREFKIIKNTIDYMSRK